MPHWRSLYFTLLRALYAARSRRNSGVLKQGTHAAPQTQLNCGCLHATRDEVPVLTSRD